MANQKYAASDKPVPVAELVATLSDGNKVKRRIPRILRILGQLPRTTTGKLVRDLTVLRKAVP